MNRLSKATFNGREHIPNQKPEKKSIQYTFLDGANRVDLTYTVRDNWLGFRLSGSKEIPPDWEKIEEWIDTVERDAEKNYNIEYGGAAKTFTEKMKKDYRHGNS